jgi:hypothetical protein
LRIGAKLLQFRKKNYLKKVGDWNLETGNGRLRIEDWKLETGNY